MPLEGYVESQHLKIHYLMKREFDPQKISLLFVPGVMMPAWIWDKQLDYFSDRYNAIAMDLRSQGLSEPTTEGHYAISMAHDIRAVVETLGLQKLVLIGWSLAVPQVINYAANFDLLGLVIVDGIAGIDSSLPFYKKMVDYWLDFQTDREEKTEEFIRSIFKQPHPEEFYQRLKKEALQVPTNTVITLMENYILQDFRNLLPRINTPTWVNSMIGPRLEYMKEIQKMIPNSSIEIFEDAGHTLFVDQPDRFNQGLEKFVEVCVN